MMSEIKSIWDGWEKQLYGSYGKGEGATCAQGYIMFHNKAVDCVQNETYTRVAAYIREHFNVPVTYNGLHPRGDNPYCDLHCIVYANNVLELTPEQFREIDRLTQIEAAVKPLVDSIDVPETVVP
jgi:hypothetical protein